MIGKNLGRRLKRLEEEILPSGEEQVVIIHINSVDSDGRVASTQELRAIIPPSPPKRRR